MSSTEEESFLREIRDFIHGRTGLFFPETKFSGHIQKFIAENMSISPANSVEEYVKYLDSYKGRSSLNRLISLLTTNETFFFRGKNDFSLLKNQLLPEIISSKVNNSKTINIWSAGCSTGEEPYSVAILLKGLIPSITKWKIEIMATDIDGDALTLAEKGNYTKWSFRGVENSIINKHFTASKDGRILKINDEYRSFIKFRQHNLTKDPIPYPDESGTKFDLITCRNVTIYFKKETTQKISKNFYTSLNDGGYLLVGHAEHSPENYPLFKSRIFPNTIVYQKNSFNEFTTTATYSLEKPQNKEKQTAASNIVKNGSGITKNKMLNVLKDNLSKLNKKQDSNSLFEQRKGTKEEGLFFREAMEYSKKKDYESAIDTFLRILDINPSNIRASWMLSHIAANRGHHEEAIAWGEKCIKIDPLFKESYYTLALIYLSIGKYEEAEKNLKKAIYIDPGFSIAYFTLGNIYTLMQLQTNANKCYKTASNILSSKSTDEIISETENITAGELLELVDLNYRDK